MVRVACLVHSCSPSSGPSIGSSCWGADNHVEGARENLCIEDDRETAALIAEELLDRGFVVDVAYNGREGLTAILQRTPDLVLCDISMPYMSGFDVLACLSEIAPSFGYMPFVFLTALTDRETELKGRQLGADDYVIKPIDFDILVAIVNARLARAPRNETLPIPSA